MSKDGRLNFVCVDDSQFSDNGFDWYLKQYHRPDDVIGIVHVQKIPTFPVIGGMGAGVPMVEEHQKNIEKCVAEANAVKEKFKKICDRKKLKCEYFLPHGHYSPGHVICELAKEKKADGIVLGQRGLGTVSRALLGSTSDYILHHSEVPVMVVPGEGST